MWNTSKVPLPDKQVNTDAIWRTQGTNLLSSQRSIPPFFHTTTSERDWIGSQWANRAGLEVGGHHYNSNHSNRTYNCLWIHNRSHVSYYLHAIHTSCQQEVLSHAASWYVHVGQHLTLNSASAQQIACWGDGSIQDSLSRPDMNSGKNYLV